jgi:nucleotide-binding universal stress UspA family protein
MPPHPVVLGTKHGEREEVLSFAVEEAVRRETRLRVVHASDNAHRAEAFVVSVERIVASQPADVEVDFVAVRGGATHVLLDEARSAAALVVGTDDVPWMGHVIGVDISQSVAARSSAPVVVVPPTVVDRAGSSGVVAALDSTGSVDGQLAFALETAARQGEPLHVICAAGVLTDYSSRLGRWARLEDAVDHWRARYPEVEVRTTVEPGLPVHTSVVASAGASVLVVGQPSGKHSRWVGQTVVARLLRRSFVPVAVVPLDYGQIAQRA